MTVRQSHYEQQQQRRAAHLCIPIVITDRISNERNKIGRVRPSVGFPSTLTFEPPDLDFCTCMSHDHSSLGIEKCHRLIDQRQRLRLTESYGYTVIELASTVTRLVSPRSLVKLSSFFLFAQRAA